MSARTKSWADVVVVGWCIRELWLLKVLDCHVLQQHPRWCTLGGIPQQDMHVVTLLWNTLLWATDLSHGFPGLVQKHLVSVLFPKKFIHLFSEFREASSGKLSPSTLSQSFSAYNALCFILPPEVYILIPCLPSVSTQPLSQKKNEKNFLLWKKEIENSDWWLLWIKQDSTYLAGLKTYGLRTLCEEFLPHFLSSLFSMPFFWNSFFSAWKWRENVQICTKH